MYLKQPGVTCACGPFTKNKERFQKFKETGNTNYIDKNELVFNMPWLMKISKIQQEEHF